MSKKDRKLFDHIMLIPYMAARITAKKQWIVIKNKATHSIRDT